MLGIWMKLKYQRMPIHITPLSTCSHRNRNFQNAASKGMDAA